MVAVGSLGDVQPYIALGLGLQRAGFQVQICADRVHRLACGPHPIPFARLNESPKYYCEIGNLSWVENVFILADKHPCIFNLEERTMLAISKRTIPFMSLLVFIVGCTTASPITIPTKQTVNTPVVPTQEQPTAISLPTQKPTSIPTEALAPTAALLPLEGIDMIVFGSNRDGDYTNIYMVNMFDGKITRLTTNDSNTFPGPFSPDGSKLLFTGFGLTNSFVGLMNSDGTDQVDLSNRMSTDNGFATWSPDGTQIAFTSRMEGNNEIYLMTAAGAGATPITDNPADDFAPAWSPDGTQIAFVSDRDNPIGVNNLYLMNVDGTGIIRLTTGSEIDYGPAWSPDGNQIAFRADIDGNGDIYIVNADGSGRVNLTNNPANDWAPAWSPVGGLIAFQTNRDGNWEIYVMRSDGSDQINLTENPADDQMPYWKPKGSGTN